MKKTTILISFILTICLSAYSQDTNKNWTLAASEFDLLQRVKEGDIAKSYTKTIPALILEQIAENLNRLPRAQEQLDRVLFDLKKKRLALFLQLSKEVKSRDAVLLNDYSERKLKRKLKESDKKIDDVEKQIAENLKQVQEEKDKRASQIELDKIRQKHLEEGNFEALDTVKKKRTVAQYFKDMAKKENERIELENVTLYGSDFTKLFDAGKEKKDKGYKSFDFEKAVTDASINALIVGNITVYGNFVNVAVSLYRYPGCVLLASATDVGTKDDLKGIAISISNALTPKIADSMSVRLDIAITPEDIVNDVTIAIDDVVYAGGTRQIVIPSGVHTITFSRKGYVTESTSYAFSGSRDFKIDVALQEDKPSTLSLAFKKPLVGDIYANGVLQSKTSAQNRFSPITINNKQILGHFISENGVPCDFLIETKFMSEGAILIAGAKPYDRSDYIEKKRLWMYRAYSVLIVSLIPTFFCYGNNGATAFAYNKGRGIERDVAANWLLATNITTGISVACAAVFVYTLVRYLIAADTVLPVRAKPIKEKKRFRISNAESYARIIAAQEKQQKADEEATKKLLEEAAATSDGVENNTESDNEVDKTEEKTLSPKD